MLLRTLAAQLAGGLTEEKIDAAFAALPAAAPVPGGPINETAVPVCALQVAAKAYGGLGPFVNDIDRYLSAAADSGARLVCFPEYFGLFSAFASPAARGVFRLLPTLLKGDDGDADEAGGAADEGKKPADLTPPRGPALYRPFAFLEGRYLSIMARFARRYGLWLGCGSVLALEAGRLYNRHTLLTAEGKIAGRQDKMHLVAEERAFGLSPGRSLSVVPTPFGRIALTVCMDASYFEPFKIAKSRGADFAIVPIANLEPYNYHLAQRGAAMRTTECNLVIVKPALVAGAGFPLGFTGQAGVYYPLGYKEKTQETGTTGPAALMARLDLPALRAYTPEGFCLENEAFNQNYLTHLLQL